MANPYRAMCAELVAAWDDLPWEYDFKGNVTGIHGDLYDDSAVDLARALLDQPEQVAPTVMEIIELHTWLEDEWRANNDGEDLPMVDYARAVLAKWGRPTPQPKEADLATPTLMERAMGGDATAAKQFLHEAGFTDKQGQWLPQYQPISDATND